MIARMVTAALVVALVAPAALAQHGLQGEETAPANPPKVVPCKATVAGAVKASFDCKADMRMLKEGGLRLAFTPGKLPKSVAAFMAGPVEVAGPAKAQTYTQQSLQAARVMLNGPQHAAYGAEVGKPPRGDLKLKLDRVEVAEHHASAKGSLVARLVPLDPKKKGEVQVTITF